MFSLQQEFQNGGYGRTIYHLLHMGNQQIMLTNFLILDGYSLSIHTLGRMARHTRTISFYCSHRKDYIFSTIYRYIFPYFLLLYYTTLMFS